MNIRFLHGVCVMKVFTVILLISICMQYINPHNLPSLSILKNMHKKYPIMQLDRCKEAVNQCRMFTSCKGVFVQLSTGQCLLDHSNSTATNSTTKRYNNK